MTNDRQRKLDTDKLMMRVAKHLEGKWKLDKRYADSHWQAIIVNGDGKALSVDFSKTGRLFIIGSGWPIGGKDETFYPHHECIPKISVAADKGPKTIAKEITRRLFPDYYRAFTEQEKVAAEYDEAAKKKERITDIIHGLIGGESRTENGQTVFDLDGYGKQITVTSGGQVSIEFRYLESGEALKIIRAMKRHITDK